MPEIISLGELLVEIMRVERDKPHERVGEIYKGPYPSGAPAIFIDSAARMSKPFKLTTGFIGVIGNDGFGNSIINALKSDGVDITKIRVDNQKTTGIAFNQYNSDGTRKFIFAPGAAGAVSPDDVDENYFENVKALHIMGSSLSISESSRQACYKAVKLAKRINSEVIISFDPNLRPEMLDLATIIKISKPILELTTILLPSGEELEMITGIDNPQKACMKLINDGIKIVVLKQGEKGCVIYTSDLTNGMEIPGFNVNEIDPTGAGDAFGGAFVVGYLQNWHLKKIGIIANAVGALKVTHFGPIPSTTYEEVIAFIKKKESS